MNDFIIHDAIRNLYPNVVTIREGKHFDENNNEVTIDMDTVMVEAERISNLPPANSQQSLLDLIAELRAEINELKNK